MFLGILSRTRTRALSRHPFAMEAGPSTLGECHAFSMWLDLTGRKVQADDCSILPSRETLLPLFDLVIDSCHSVLDCDIRSLEQLCCLHGIMFDTFNESGTRLLALSHVLRGGCFVGVHSSRPGCFAVCETVRNARAFRTSLLGEVIQFVDDSTRLRNICNALGMTYEESRSIRSKNHFLSFIEAIRSGFASYRDVSALVQDVDSHPLHIILIALRAHGLQPSGSPDDMRSQLVSHVVINDCVFSGEEHAVPVCRVQERGNDSMITLLETVLNKKFNKRPLLRVMRSLAIDFDPAASLHQLRSALKVQVKLLKKGKPSKNQRRTMNRALSTQRQASYIADVRRETNAT